MVFSSQHFPQDSQFNIEKIQGGFLHANREAPFIKPNEIVHVFDNQMANILNVTVPAPPVPHENIIGNEDEKLHEDKKEPNDMKSSTDHPREAHEDKRQMQLAVPHDDTAPGQYFA